MLVSAMKDGGAVGVTQNTEEREKLISELQANLLEKEREQKEMAERITNLSR